MVRNADFALLYNGGIQMLMKHLNPLLIIGLVVKFSTVKLLSMII